MSERFAHIVERYFTRRQALVAAGAALASPFLVRAQAPAREFQAGGVLFTPIEPSTADGVKVAAGHRVQVLLRWGDPLFPNAPAFDPRRQTPTAQAQQFGYNCDYVGFLPFSANNSEHGLLVVNHEYTNPELMFDSNPDLPTAEEVETQIAAHGLSIVEIKRQEAGHWAVIRDSKCNRRITANTPFLITGPARGNARMATGQDPVGQTVLGTLNNCSGGKTPWNTVLSGEENFQGYFSNADKLPRGELRDAHQRYGLLEKQTKYFWARHVPRFDVLKEPHEPFRFGWLVEIDPFDPTSPPKKRTAMGRFRHEAASFMKVEGRPLAVYSGDDESFECVYKFVTKKPWNPTDKQTNRDLLDEGTLYAARFKDDGTGVWLPLQCGHGPLVASNGFHDQGDVVINPRKAADLLGATQMDRPEDIEVHPQTRNVYIALTNNEQRGLGGRPRPDSANPTTKNTHGHIIELIEKNDDPAATEFVWDIFVRCVETKLPPRPDGKVPQAMSCPDNLLFDLDGNLWIATDGQFDRIAVNDGLFVMNPNDRKPRQPAQFFAAVKGAEVCGPEFTPDNTSLFLAIQHPGEGGSYRNPESQWPDGQSPPRPSVVVVTADHGGRVGSKQAD